MITWSSGRKLSRHSALGLIGPGVWPVPQGFAAGTTSVLHVRVVSDESGETSPCSAMLQDSAGTVVLENPSYTGGCRSSGESRKELPAGLALLLVTRGFDLIGMEL